MKNAVLQAWQHGHDWPGAPQNRTDDRIFYFQQITL